MSNDILIDYEQVFNSLLTFQVLLDLDFKIIGATDAYVGISLASREAIMGMSILEAFPENPDNPHSDGMHKLGESLQQVLKTKQTQDMGILRYDIPSGTGDGKFVERWWRCRNNPVLDSNGEVRWIVANVDDINGMMDMLESAEDTLKLKK
jgi:PAS domain-containing protein